MIVEVLLPVPLNRGFDYLVEDDKSIAIGQRVLVEFGQSKKDNTTRQVVGIVTAIKSSSDFDQTLKPVLRVLDSFPIVDEQWLALLRFTARYYATPLAKLLTNALPKLIRSPNKLSRPEKKFYHLTEHGMNALTSEVLPKNATKQRALLSLLESNGGLDDAAIKQADFSSNDCNRLIEKGYIHYTLQNPFHESSPVKPQPYALNIEQSEIINRIQQTAQKPQSAHQPHLIYGITGSGKTEIYIQLITDCIQNNQQVLLLVPEISLTPQMLTRFIDRFGHRVAALHSGLSDNERASIWLSARHGDLPILIGTRSAIFTPFESLGLIIVDEEHDMSYKQQDGIPYHARNLALYRAHQQQIPIVLGSATPSLESLYACNNGDYHFHQLTNRATEATLPTVHILDRRGESTQQAISEKLLQKIRQTVHAKQQVLVFLNRRGFSPVLMCASCQWKSECPTCDSHQTAHTSSRQLHCHLCGHVEALPTVCPACHSHELHFIGHGTEKVESQLKTQFPHHRILRLDRDKQTTAKQLNDALAQINRQEIDIIVGTQLIVKGHHFPQVTLVCAVDSDQALFSSDFRAEERLFQQLIQVAGRAGRESNHSDVYIQTALPTHPIFAALQQHDYYDYAQQLLSDRKIHELPPYRALLLIKANALDYAPLMQFLRELKYLIEQHSEAITLLGPAPSPIERIKNRYQAQLYVSAENKKALQREIPLIQRALSHIQKGKNIRVLIDVDAIES